MNSFSWELWTSWVNLVFDDDGIEIAERITANNILLRGRKHNWMQSLRKKEMTRIRTIVLLTVWLMDCITRSENKSKKMPLSQVKARYYSQRKQNLIIGLGKSHNVLYVLNSTRGRLSRVSRKRLSSQRVLLKWYIVLHKGTVLWRSKDQWLPSPRWAQLNKVQLKRRLGARRRSKTSKPQGNSNLTS